MSNTFDYTDVFDAIQRRFVDESSPPVVKCKGSEDRFIAFRNVAKFPKSAFAFIDAIRKNRCLQTLMNGKMVEMEVRIEQLDKLIERVKELKMGRRGFSIQRDARLQLISVRKRRESGKTDDEDGGVHALYKGPLENSHVGCYEEALAKFPVDGRRGKWSEDERINLLNGLKQQFQRTLFEQAVDELSDPDNLYVTSKNFDSVISSIHNIDITPEQIRLFLPKVNWKQLASMYVPGRSDAECQSRFLNFEDPLMNQGEWIVTEEKTLLHVLQQKGLHNWIGVAGLVGTHRTPFQCLARYQRSLNASILKREWTTEEDNQLRAAVESYGESDWQLIASVMDGRTGEQCSNRWLKTLHPARKTVGKWSDEEDKNLKVAVTLFGPKTWKKVAKYVPGRTEVQCRERWLNCLDPALNMEKWSEEEDCKLKSAISEHGYCWSKVAASVSHRTDNQCLRRWKVLFPHETCLRQAARKIQKSALISNFVSRESERPTLGPNDFEQPEIIRNIETKNDVPSRRGKRKSSSMRTKEDTHPQESCAVKKKADVSNFKRRPGMRKKRQATEREDPDPGEECGLPSTDATFNRVIAGEERHGKTSKLHPRRKGDKPNVEATETAYEKEMRTWEEASSKTNEA